MSASRGVVLHPRTGRALDALSIDQLRATCILGLYAAERERPQAITVALTLHFDTSEVAERGDLRFGVDYARLAGELRFLLEACRFQTLETAAIALARYVLLPAAGDRSHPPIEAVDLKLDKPEAFSADDGGAIPSLSVRRYTDAQTYLCETKPWGYVDVVHELSAPSATDTPSRASYGIYRLRIAPGASLPTHVHRRMHEAELVLGSSLHLQGKPAIPGTAYAWSHGFAHRWDNVGTEENAILCVDRPRFLPEDEVECDVPPEALVEPRGMRFYPANERKRSDMISDTEAS